MTTTVGLLFLFIAAVPLAAASPTNFTAVFSFGDSILDAGNNNGLLTFARANHPPYGINFPGGIPTGRFSDGKLASDIIATNLGIKPAVPAYLDPSVTDKDLLTGVSFASAGTGVDGAVTPKVGNVLSMDKQLEYFRQALERIRRSAGDGEVNRTVGNALFLISAASNDMLIDRYIFPLRNNFPASEYEDFLLMKIEGFIRSLQDMGARKLAVLGLGPLGCLPLIMSLHDAKHLRPESNRTCVDQYNLESQAINVKLQALLSRLPASLPTGAKLAYVETYAPAYDMIKNPSAYGFERADLGCCGHGTLELGPFCNQLSRVCPNPTKYMFWDSVHPSQRVYDILAQRIIKYAIPKLL